MYSSIKIARFELKMAFPDMSYEARIYIHLENKFCVFVWIVDAIWVHKSWENIRTMVSAPTRPGVASEIYEGKRYKQILHYFRAWTNVIFSKSLLQCLYIHVISGHSHAIKKAFFSQFSIYCLLEMYEFYSTTIRRYMPVLSRSVGWTSSFTLWSVLKRVPAKFPFSW